MKKTLWIVLTLFLAVSLSACSGSGVKNKASTSNSSTVAQVMEDAMQESASAASEADASYGEAPSPAAATPSATPTPSLEAIDISSEDAEIDLTLLSGNMVYAQVSQMLYSPDAYLGKTVKMKGDFIAQEEESRNYYACFVQDATACCANGIEFELAEDLTYPDDFPAVGEEVTVIGTYDLYEENGFYFAQLSDARMIF